ncbi:hypothetical protein QBC38DRAFT_501448 [Podospora fimiseda]|uniref:Uncharacterized protein n=1 Tax=Podospora fimiseda TaxID=252190 RepID=A0AAN7BL47_9PEZI|nr:hypothetical protein QBC38DRAFT_501448 [Podospora fimiseda]
MDQPNKVKVIFSNSDSSTEGTALTPDLDTSLESDNASHCRRKDYQWSVHWYLPFMMTLLYISGVCFAIGHHLYYQSMEGENVDKSEWPIRFGIALAFLTQRCFVGATQGAYKQYTWCTLQKTSLRISTIDALFVGSTNPIGTLNLEFLKKATSQFLLAAACWLLPLAAITTPSSLTAMAISGSKPCKNVSTIYFLKDGDFNDDGTNVKGKENLRRVYYWDIIDNNTTTNRETYAMPTYEFGNLIDLALKSTNGPLAGPNPCGPKTVNCAYTIQFDGPAYTCEDKADFDGSTNQTLDMFPPRGEHVYSASPIVNYNHRLDKLGRPVQWANLTTKDPMYGVFTREYPIWLGYSFETTRPHKGPNNTLWPYELEHNIIKCTLNYARYEVTLGFMDGKQVVYNTKVDAKGPLLPEGQQMEPSNKEYAEYAAYHTLGFRFHQYIQNGIQKYNSSTRTRSDSRIGETTLVNRKSGMSVPRQFENKFYELVLSLLSRSEYRVTMTDYPCTLETGIQVWHYQPFWLLLPYGIAAGVALLAVGTGVYAFGKVGYGMDTGFSTILAVTRGNKELDDLMAGYSLGCAPLPKGIMKTRLKFGEVVDDQEYQKGNGGERKAGFGTEGKVRDIRVGERYH